LGTHGMILITGASGFLGSHLANYSAKRGRDVRCVVRRTSETSALNANRMDIRQADLSDPSSLRAALESPVRTVVHCAATTSETKVDYAQSFQVNVEGTRNLLQACRDQGVERFIMISTQSANERNPSTYARTKLAADLAVQESPLAYTILKPSTIYGPGSKGLFAKMVRLLDSVPVVPILGSGSRLIRPIHVFDLCEAILECEDSGQAFGKTYDLGGRDLVSYEDFIGSILQARRKKKPFVYLSLPVCRALAAAFSFLKNPPFTRDNVLGLNQNQVCSIDAARNDFGFSPRGLREGLTQTFSATERSAAGTEVLQDGGNKAIRKEQATQNVAIIGLGKMGLLHASILSILPSARIVGLIDQDEALGAHVRSMGLQAPFHKSIDEVLGRSSVDAVFVCTPAFTHYSIVRQLVEKNLNIFLEKPLAESLDSARKICDLLKDRSIVHAVGFMKAHNPVYERAREIVSRGVLGKDILFRSTLYLSQVFAPKRGWVYDPKKSGGGIVANSTCHLLYLLYRLFGPLRSVCGQTRRFHSEQVEDAATALMEFGNGVAGTLDTSWSTPGYPVEQTEIFLQGSGGILEISDTRLRLNLNEGTKEYEKGWTTWHRAEMDVANFDLSPQYGGEGYYNEDLDFIKACRQKGTPRVSWFDGLKVQEIMDALYRSASEGLVKL
jgi:predicted dehydrogenase/nucleoside-diphosphate-sugar epimerase